MIILLSTTEFEYSTDEIAEWLSFYGANYVRINGEELEENDTKITLDNSDLLERKGIDLTDKLTIFNRRWTRFSTINSMRSMSTETNFGHQIKNFLKLEFLTATGYIRDLLDTPNAIWIDDPKAMKLNKLSVLKKAKRFGLRVPNTLVTNKKSDLIEFKTNHNQVITKSIGDLVPMENTSKFFSIGTKEMTTDFINELPSRFYLSKFQELIQKKYEIRSFYLDGSFYSMAIFSQRREAAKIDFRNYNFNDPDRMEPFRLPKLIREKLDQLMKTLNLKTGSIDLICTPDDEFIFLEVNPVGQFGMVSKPCNYYLEKVIAEYLIKTDNR